MLFRSVLLLFVNNRVQPDPFFRDRSQLTQSHWQDCQGAGASANRSCISVHELIASFEILNNTTSSSLFPYIIFAEPPCPMLSSPLDGGLSVFLKVDA